MSVFSKSFRLFFARGSSLRAAVCALVFAASIPVACDGLLTQQLKVIDIYVDEIHVRAELAQTPETRQRGLMYRSKLGLDEGMLFVFPRPRMQSFWMKNTLIPLDIAYFDSQGFLINIHTMEPDGGKKTYPSSEPALYALEMNKGWFKKHGLRKYARLKLPGDIKGL